MSPVNEIIWVKSKVLLMRFIHWHVHETCLICKREGIPYHEGCCRRCTLPCIIGERTELVRRGTVHPKVNLMRLSQSESEEDKASKTRKRDERGELRQECYDFHHRYAASFACGCY